MCVCVCACVKKKSPKLSYFYIVACVINLDVLQRMIVVYKSFFLKYSQIIMNKRCIAKNNLKNHSVAFKK